MIRSYKVRLFPTKDQEQLMWQHIGACRYVYNWMLSEQMRLFEAGEKHLSAFSMMKLLTHLKQDGAHAWLYDVSNATLQKVCQDLQFAYENFFNKRRKFPKFKSRKHARASFPARGNNGIYFKCGNVNIEKIGKVKYQTNYELPQGKGLTFTNPRVSYMNNKWILGFGIECENQAFELTEKRIGIDLGVKELAVVAHEDEQIVFHNINKSRRVKQLKNKLKHIQRNISRKYVTNGNYHKTSKILKEETKAAKIWAKLANIRKDYIHKTTHQLVALNPARVVMEDLDVCGMMKNKHLSKALAEQGLGEFIKQMKYKCEWRGIEFVQVDRFYPSSKTCSCCGNIKHDLKLTDRTYICENCGVVLDRDFNAAINLMKYAG